MDVPKSFAIKKNLTTKELIEKAEQKPKKSELEKLLDEFNNPNYSESEFFHMTIEALVQKKDYRTLGYQSMIGWDYWTKSKNEKESYLFIRKNQKKRKSYILATVKNDNLEKFCKRFEKIEGYNQFYNQLRCLRYSFKFEKYSRESDFLHFFMYTLAPAMGMAALTAQISTHNLQLELETTKMYSMIATGLGLYFGSLFGCTYKYLRNKIGEKRYRKELITGSKEAVKAAFS